MQLAFELALLGIALQRRKDGRVYAVGSRVQSQRVNGVSRSIRIGKLASHRRERRHRRAHGIDLAPAQRVRFVHAFHHDGAVVAIEAKTILPARPDPVAAVLPLPTRADAQAPAFVQIVLQGQRFQRAVGNG